MYLYPLRAVLVVLAHEEGQRAKIVLLGNASTVSIIGEVMQFHPVLVGRLHLQPGRVGKSIGDFRAIRLACHVTALVVSIHPAECGIHNMKVGAL